MVKNPWHDQLQKAANELKAELGTFPGAIDIADDFKPGKEEKRANCPKARKKAVPLAGKGHLTMQQKILRGQRFLRVLKFVEKLLDELFNSSNFVNTMRVLPTENKAVVQITQVSIQKRVCNTISRRLDLASRETSIRTTYF